jgi:NADH dehydrogenase FAD-containing subunit
MEPHRIVIVGGGGLELATRLGDKFGKPKRARVTLVDAKLTHLWKPLLHEVAAGTFDSHENDVDYIAQAHQQAALLVKSIARRMQGKTLPAFIYRDRGSLISLAHYTTVGSLMGNLTGNVMIEGWFARLAYRMLYRLHQRALHGTLPMLLLMSSDFLQQRTQSRVKLH